MQNVTPPTPNLSRDPWVVIAALIPLGQLITIPLIGQLYLSDVLVPALLLYTIRLHDSVWRLRQISSVLGLLALWLIAQVISDLVNVTPAENFLKGWAKILSFGMHVTALWLFLPRRRAYILAFALGCACAWALSVPEQYALFPWKFGYDRALMFGITAVLGFGMVYSGWARAFAPAIMIACSAFPLLYDARSAFAIALFTGLSATGALFVESWPALRQKLRLGGYLLLLAGGGALAMAVSAGYGALVQDGQFGSEARARYLAQTRNGSALVVAARAESRVSLHAIADAPLLGHGSWAEGGGYLDTYRAERLKDGLPIDENYFVTARTIPAHSYALGAWVEAGLAGALFWIAIFTLPFRAALHLYRRFDPLAPLAFFCAVSLVWAIPFSPFGGAERFFAAFAIVVLMTVIHKREAVE